MICLYAAQEEMQVRYWEENLGTLIYRPRPAPFRGEAFLYRKKKCPVSMSNSACFMVQLAGSLCRLISFITTLRTLDHA